MPRRSITDEEIGLIKPVLSRGMRNRDVERLSNPMNFGAVTVWPSERNA
jgi:hypothetical protein